MENYCWSVSRWAKPVTPVAIGETDLGCFGRPPLSKRGDYYYYCFEIIEWMLAFVRLYLISQT